MSSGFGFVGPYRLLNCINTGQTSRLWQAYDDINREYVAVKTLQDTYSKNREQLQMLNWEFAVGSKLVDPRVIRFRYKGKDRGQHYVVMEWFSAPNLKARINKGYEVYERLIPAIIKGTSEAVAYFNSEGWIHRDIKPDNFLVDDTGNVKLIDFALAQKPAGAWAKLFNFGQKIAGTASYMSPEQIRGKSLDSRSDVYSLGCTLYELLAGRPPFTGETVSDLLQKHIRQAAPPVAVQNSNVTPAFNDLLMMAMSKNPDKRPETSRDFARMLTSTRPLKRMPKQDKAEK